MRKDATLEVFQGRLSLHIHTFSDSCDNVVCAWRDLLPLFDQQVGSRLQSKTILLHRESGCLRGLPAFAAFLPSRPSSGDSWGPSERRSMVPSIVNSG
jgi:hypothetical protein